MSSQNEQRLRALLVAKTSSIYRMSPDWRLMYQLDSDTLADTTDPIENWADKYILNEDRALVFGAIQRSVESKSLFELEHRVRLADGRVGWTLSRAAPILDEAGEIIEWFGTAKDITELKQAALDRLELIRHSLAEKEELLKEVHHRVKNNLQVITSLLNLQAETIQEPTTLAAFTEAANRIQSISTIHDLLYRSDSFSSIRLRDYAEQLIPSLVRFYGMHERVRAEVSGDETTIELGRAVPFGLLLNELVSNTLKHAFPGDRTGELLVSIGRVGSDTVLRVSDTGIGLPPLFDPLNTQSLGLKLVTVFMRQMRGEIKVLPGTGTTFEARFPAVDVLRQEAAN